MFWLADEMQSRTARNLNCHWFYWPILDHPDTGGYQFSEDQQHQSYNINVTWNRTKSHYNEIFKTSKFEYCPLKISYCVIKLRLHTKEIKFYQRNFYILDTSANCRGFKHENSWLPRRKGTPACPLFTPPLIIIQAMPPNRLNLR